MYDRSVNILDDHAILICGKLLKDLTKVNQGTNSIKFFRQDIVTMIIWLFIIDSYGKKKIINIEDIAREISQATRISKPSLRLILEKAKEQKFIKFTHNPKDTRSWIIEPEIITINEFNIWTKEFI